MTASLLSKLDDSANPGTPSVWLAAVVLLLVLLLVGRCLLPQIRELRRRRAEDARHREHMAFEERKNRER